MELITILNRCRRFRGFVYKHAHFGVDKKSIEVVVRPRKGSSAEFILFWGFFVFLLYSKRRADCRRCAPSSLRKFPGAMASAR
jgi:transposase